MGDVWTVKTEFVWQYVAWNISSFLFVCGSAREEEEEGLTLDTLNSKWNESSEKENA